MNPNLIRWIYASIIKHYNAYKGSFPMSVNPEYVDPNEKTTRSWAELRIDGPFMRALVGCTQYDMEVNLLFSNHLDSDAPRRLAEMQGSFLQAVFDSQLRPRPIEVRKYGDEPEDTGDYVGCLTLFPIVSGDREIRAFNLHQVDIATNLQQGGLEAHYRMILNNAAIT